MLRACIWPPVARHAYVGTIEHISPAHGTLGVKRGLIVWYRLDAVSVDTGLYDLSCNRSQILPSCIFHMIFIDHFITLGLHTARSM